MFIGRSNVHRLYLSSYLYSNTKSNQTFHCNPKVESHRHNIGLEELLELYDTKNVDHVFDLIKNGPITKDKLTYPIYSTHHHDIYKEYNNSNLPFRFVVCILCMFLLELHLLLELAVCLFHLPNLE